MKSSLYTLGYAGVFGIVCASLLTSAATFTGPYKDANAKAEEILNILQVLRVPAPTNISPKQLIEVFNANVREQELGERTIYFYWPEASSTHEAAAVRFSGPGLWGPIKGFLALEPDMETIRGVTFYEQEETPGLGGEIAAPWFRDQFAGKSIKDESGNAGIIIRSSDGKPTKNQVDSITGATMTCRKVEAMLNAVIKELVEENAKNGKK